MMRMIVKWHLELPALSAVSLPSFLVLLCRVACPLASDGVVSDCTVSGGSLHPPYCSPQSVVLSIRRGQCFHHSITIRPPRKLTHAPRAQSAVAKRRDDDTMWFRHCRSPISTFRLTFIWMHYVAPHARGSAAARVHSLVFYPIIVAWLVTPHGEINRAVARPPGHLKRSLFSSNPRKQSIVVHHKKCLYVCKITSPSVHHQVISLCIS